MAILKNLNQLARTPERKKILASLEAGYQAINLANLLREKISFSQGKLRVADTSYNLRKYRKIAVIGIGKCALATALYLEKILGKRISAGITLDVKRGKTKYVQSLQGTHPLPSNKNLAASKKILRLISALDPKKDLLIFIVSGGGSSLFFLPSGISVGNLIKLTLDLHKSGANIHEFNCVRKHLSAVQGGKLAALIYPQKTLALYFSDVISKTDNKNLNTIASGPLQPDRQTNQAAINVLKKYRLWNKYKSKIEFFSETIKDKHLFRNIDQKLLLTNETALEAISAKAVSLKLKPRILGATFSVAAEQAFTKIRSQAAKFPKSNLFILGGELTIKVRGKGKGGRNQQAALASLAKIKPGEVFCCAASDGIDNTAYAGAIVDELAKRKAAKLKLNPTAYLKRNDSFNFFRRTNDYLLTGKTGTNVADLLLYYRKGNNE